MRILIQECLKASVTIDNKIYSEINNGEVLFVGFTSSDDEKVVDKMIEKLFKLRIFDDENGKTNLSLTDINGDLLCVSQFTLYADLSQGNRPSFVNAMKADEARKLFSYFCDKVKERKEDVKFGVFQADMKVNVLNNGPFSIMMDSKELVK